MTVLHDNPEVLLFKDLFTKKQQEDIKRISAPKVRFQDSISQSDCKIDSYSSIANLNFKLNLVFDNNCLQLRMAQVINKQTQKIEAASYRISKRYQYSVLYSLLRISCNHNIQLILMIIPEWSKKAC